jgi:hypothetical protein
MHGDGKIVLHTYVWLTNNGCKDPEVRTQALVSGNLFLPGYYICIVSR